jgi:hypothetical protein
VNTFFAYIPILGGEVGLEQAVAGVVVGSLWGYACRAGEQF